MFERLRLNNLKFKPTKCNFLQRQAKFLGHKISGKGVASDPDKIKIV